MDNVNYTFQEICKKTGYTASAIRYYEKEFNLVIPRNNNGRRLFTKIEFDKLLFIKELQEQNYPNSAIKKILIDKVNISNTTANENESQLEIAATTDSSVISAVNSISNLIREQTIINFIDTKFKEVNENILTLNVNINGKERDLLISENMKLKMELKRKSYEMIELKENLRFFKNKNQGFFKRLFGKKLK